MSRLYSTAFWYWGLASNPLMMLELRDRRQAQRDAKRALRKPTGKMTRDEAAFKIQGMYRGWLSRNAVRAIIRSLYEKLYDAQRGTYYYFNHQFQLRVLGTTSSSGIF